jgi:hypothetical protein
MTESTAASSRKRRYPVDEVRGMVLHGEDFLAAAISRFTSLSRTGARVALRKAGSVDAVLRAYCVMMANNVSLDEALGSIVTAPAFPLVGGDPCGCVSAVLESAPCPECARLLGELAGAKVTRIETTTTEASDDPIMVTISLAHGQEDRP